MFGLDDKIAAFSDGTTLLVVLAVAVVLGLRHASDPDHLAAVTTLVASGKERAARGAARLGLAWGLGHATSLFVLGLPVVLYSAYLPEPVQSAAETAVGFVIVALAVLLLVRWRRGAFRDGPHEHAEVRHAHVHSRRRPHAHGRTRTTRTAYAIGLVHGMGGTAGVGLLLLAGIRNHELAVGALALFAFCTAVSMAVLSTGLGLTLGAARVRRSFQALAPALGVLSLAFGVWYALGAQQLVPYVF
jgi:ABC-type nickel/cobalt efflux system permease component RcnA